MTKKPVRSGKKLQIKKETLRDLDAKGKVRGGNLAQADPRARNPLVLPNVKKVESAFFATC